MISDEYTREYDERQQIKMVERVAAKFGCRMQAKREYGGVTIKIHLPNGKPFHNFSNITKAVEWAAKWT